MSPGSRRRSDAADPRRAAFRILRRVEEEGAYASILLDHAEPLLADPRDAALLHELVLGILRHREEVDYAVSRVSRRRPERLDPPVRIALRIGAYGILFLDRIPEFAAVDTAVELAKRAGAGRAAGFVNAVLRSISRSGRDLLPPPPAEGDAPGLARHLSHPAWWTLRVVDRLGWNAAVELLEADNRPPPVTLRADLNRTTPRDLLLRLTADGVRAEPGVTAPEAVRVLSGPWRRSRALSGGYAWVQDEASQLVPAMFGRPLRPAVLDLCAAPGTKTLQLAESLPNPGILVACDRRPGRLRRMRRSMRAHGADRVMLVAADMTRPPVPAARFDHALVDAPCSGSGTFRRHPEIRWKLRPEDLPGLVRRQGALLDAAASLLAPGGSLLYSVCSLEPEEGEGVTGEFLRAHPEFRAADPRPRLPATARGMVGADLALRTSPAIAGLDGFYALLMVKGRAARGVGG